MKIARQEYAPHGDNRVPEGHLKRFDTNRLHFPIRNWRDSESTTIVALALNSA